MGYMERQLDRSYRVDELWQSTNQDLRELLFYSERTSLRRFSVLLFLLHKMSEPSNYNLAGIYSDTQFCLKASYYNIANIDYDGNATNFNSSLRHSPNRVRDVVEDRIRYCLSRVQSYQEVTGIAMFPLPWKT